MDFTEIEQIESIFLLRKEMREGMFFLEITLGEGMGIFEFLKRTPEEFTPYKFQSNPSNLHNSLKYNLPDDTDILQAVQYDNYLCSDYVDQYQFEVYLKDLKNGTDCRIGSYYIDKLFNEWCECPVCYETKQGNYYFECYHTLCENCNDCLKNSVCPICRSEEQ